MKKIKDYGKGIYGAVQFIMEVGIFEFLVGIVIKNAP